MQQKITSVETKLCLPKQHRRWIAQKAGVTPEYVSMVWGGKRPQPDNHRIWQLTRLIVQREQQLLQELEVEFQELNNQGK